MSLPENFLTQLEQYSELSQREKEVFLERFGRGKSRVQVTQALNISDSNLGSCLTGIYKKFSISGSGPVKENRLREYLSKRYAQYQPSKNLELDSEAVLKSIEGQHGLLVERAKGIYSFSHLTFQEYFAAREIVANSAWKNLVEHITQKRWREVFLLTAGMMRKADDLVWLMKGKIDGLLTEDEKLQRFLEWVTEKSSSVNAPYKPAAIRAHYFALDNPNIHSINRILSYTLDREILAPGQFIDNKIYGVGNLPQNELEDFIDFVIDDLLNSTIFDAEMNPFLLGIRRKVSGFISSKDTNLISGYYLFLKKLDLVCILDPEIEQAFHSLRGQLPNPSSSNEQQQQWWATNSSAWIKQLRTGIIRQRNIAYNWQFSNQQRQLHEQYNDANRLLIDCLNSDCYVSREVRLEIEDTLLLPMAEIEKRHR
ncbi:NACHT domain-containing protein [Scytonema sp. PRP1]|uniref:NACHT domain-containing protein n=1 Tax=Scytonema sp. PRP1 TaxID=3120513 RepID=UPI002FD16062